MNKSWASVCVQQLVVVLFLFEYQTGGVCYSQTIIYKYIYISATGTLSVRSTDVVPDSRHQELRHKHLEEGMR